MKSRTNKFNARYTQSDLIGRGFHSGAECRYAEHLWARQEAGEIDELRFQVTVPMLNGAVRWAVDFSYIEHRLSLAIPKPQRIWDECKGFVTADFKTKKAVWASGAGPGILRLTYPRDSRLYPWRWVDVIPEGFDENDNPNIVKEQTDDQED